MNFVMGKEILLENLSIVSKAVSSRSTMPILECVLISAEDQVRLTGNNLEMGIETAGMDADITEQGSVALEAKIFLEIIRKMPGDTVSFQSDANHLTKLKSGRAEFKILGLPGDEFPVLPKVPKELGYTVSASIFKDMIRQTIFSVALEESKPVLTGELLHIKDGIMHLVSVDGFRISYRCEQQETLMESDAQNVVVPAVSLNELARVLPAAGANEKDEMRFYFTDKHILFETNQYTLVSRLLEGEFIRYNQIFNEDFTTLVSVERAQLLQSLERASLIARENRKSPVKLSIEQDSIVITSSTELGASYDEVSAEIDGVTLEIAFNPRYLIEALKAIDEERVLITFTGALSPCIIKSKENENFKYLILPLRLKS
ncbi:MAG: DNA polymerase III subunit beta [Clostridiales bacterium]|jgi:DNA polymerase-3 subunit beta|nr:DNA polymerase III subunit beta [Clostridiales bacterium]